jgi:hypothetical protein
MNADHHLKFIDTLYAPPLPFFSTLPSLFLPSYSSSSSSTLYPSVPFIHLLTSPQYKRPRFLFSFLFLLSLPSPTYLSFQYMRHSIPFSLVCTCSFIIAKNLHEIRNWWYEGDDCASLTEDFAGKFWYGTTLIVRRVCRREEGKEKGERGGKRRKEQNFFLKDDL